MKRLTNKEYFSYKALSKSQLKKWNKNNPMAFWNSCVFNDNRISEEKITDSLIMGKLAHCLLFEPETFENTFTIIQEKRGYSSRTTDTFQNAIKDELDAFGKDLILEREFEEWKKRIEILKSYDIIKSILLGSTTEKPFIWTENGIELKAKLDAIKNTPQGIILIEYKTTSMIEKKGMGIDRAGYVFDVGMQCKAVEAAYEQTPVKMIFIIQSSKENEEHYIDIRTVEKQDIENCRVFTDFTITEIKNRMDMGLSEESFRTTLTEKQFSGYQDTAFSFDFDKKLSEMSF